MSKGYLSTSMGFIEVKEKDNKIIYIGFCDEKNHISDDNIVIKNCLKQLDNYFNGQLSKFDIKYKLIGTDFQKEVWNELCNIPYGKVYSYSDIANKIGRSKSVRAVANAIGANPIAIVIPCHRVVGKNGALTGYEYGIDIKEKLLKLEGVR